MSGFEMFCERCGKRYGNEETTAAESLPLGRRLLMAVGVGSTAPRPVHQDPVLRFCLACRGYTCPACWNDDAGFCQTCVPLPEPEPVAAEPDFAGVPQLAIQGAAELYTDPVHAALFGEPVSEPVAQPADAFEEAALESVAPVTWAEPVAPEVFEVEAEPVFAEAEPMLAEPEPELEAEPVFVEAEPMLAEPELEAEPMLAEPELEAEPMLAEPEPMLAEPEPELEAEPIFAEVEPMLAEPESPVEVAYAEAASYTEPEPDVQWDLSLSPEAEADAEPQVMVEPEPVLAFEPAMPEAPVIPEAPTVQVPTLPMAPIFRPLEPMGPLMPPPPPPAAAQVPRIEFDLPDAPPAFLMARPPLAPALRPTLPVGLFDGPGPTVRPCPHCELPVSAKARFCRRCGSAQG